MANLLVQNGADVCIVNKYGHSALHRAVFKGEHFHLVNNPIQVYSSKIVIVLENQNITALLIENGADVNVKDEHQQTPLHLSAKRGKYWIIDSGLWK